MYSATGGAWSYGQRITFSFVPDGTNIAGTPSTLFQSMSAKLPGQNWQNEFMKAAAVWQNVANINLVWQPYDNGAALGAPGAQQGDWQFGDIRISATPLYNGTLGVASSPPPFNGGTAAGDITLNSTTMWQIGTGYDLETVAIHEFGHALGMSHSQITTAVMYAYYNDVKQNLTSDDISGIRSIYGPRQYDGFSAGPNGNGVYYNATPLNGFMNGAGQVPLPWPLTLTTVGQAQWFWVTAPAITTGSMTVIAQATGFSMLAPRMYVYDTSFNILGQAGTPYTGSSAWLTNIPVTPGQNYLIQVGGYGGSGSLVGNFGFQVNFGSSALPPMPIYAPYISAQPDQGGGSSAMETMSDPHEQVRIGNMVVWGDKLEVPGHGTHDEPSQDVSLLPAPNPLATERVWMGAASDDPSAADSSKALHFFAAMRGARKPAYPQFRGIDRAATNWALQSAPSKLLGGRMRSGGGSTT